MPPDPRRADDDVDDHATALPRQGTDGRPMRNLYGRLLPQHRDMRPQMQDNLERLREHVGSGRTDQGAGIVLPGV